METKKINYTIFKYLLGMVFLIYYRPKFKNTKVIPKKGPMLVCGNHIHMFDQCLPILSTKRMIHYMAKKEYFDGKTSWFFKSTGCISVDRSIHDEKAKEEALSLLKDGYAVGLFPEGTRNKTNDILLPFKYGTVSMAKKTDAYVVPFGITGKYKFWNNKLTITFGTPFKVGDLTLEEANDKLRKEILQIIEE